MATVVELQRPFRTSSTLSVPVAGMTCASCVGHVEKAISKLPGVTSVNVNLATERADVSFSGAADPGAVVRAVESAGRSEEHTSELQSLMRISYAVFCLK